LLEYNYIVGPLPYEFCECISSCERCAIIPHTNKQKFEQKSILLKEFVPTNECLSEHLFTRLCINQHMCLNEGLCFNEQLFEHMCGRRCLNEHLSKQTCEHIYLDECLSTHLYGFCV
jgi:hypothetical protein